MPTNTAAWQQTVGQRFEVKAADYTSPKGNELLIKNGVSALCLFKD